VTTEIALHLNLGAKINQGKKNSKVIIVNGRTGKNIHNMQKKTT